MPMPKFNRAAVRDFKRGAGLAIVHPASTSKIERASTELVQIRTQIAELETRKKELSERLLRWVQAEGEPDDEGKVRYETDAHKFLIVEGTSASKIDPKLLMRNGVTQKVIQKSTVEGTPFSYVKVMVRADTEKE